MTQTSLVVAILQPYGGTARRKPKAMGAGFAASTECLAIAPGIARPAGYGFPSDRHRTVQVCRREAEQLDPAGEEPGLLEER
jgi:hypothetical protein